MISRCIIRLNRVANLTRRNHKSLILIPVVGVAPGSAVFRCVRVVVAVEEAFSVGILIEVDLNFPGLEVGSAVVSLCLCSEVVEIELVVDSLLS